jgi:cytochrome c
MSMRNLTILTAAGMAFAAAGIAQEAGDDLVPRQAADLPDLIGDFDERAPETVPDSSASEVAEIDPSAFRFGIGQPATEEEIAAIDIDVMPDGRGAPEGSGTFAEGEELYATHCAACHGQDLGGVEGTGGVALIGGRGTLDTDAPVKTVESYWPHASTLFDYTHRAMPFNNPGSLSPDEVYAISAYILGRAGILDEGAEMNAETFGQIEMPNVNGFYLDPRPGTGVGDAQEAE